MKRLNVKLLLWLIGITVFSVVGVYFLHGFQENRNASLLKVQAEQARTAGNDLEAIKFYNQYIRHRDDRDGYEALAELTVDVASQENATRQDHGRAYNTLEETIRRYPELDDVRASLVEYTILLRRWNDALEHIQQLEDHGIKVITPRKKKADGGKPDPISLDVYRATCYFGNGEEEKARGALFKIVGYDPESKEFAAEPPALAKETDAFILLSQILQRRGEDVPLADAVMAKMVEWNPDSAKAHIARANYLLTQWQGMRGDTPEGKDLRDQLFAETKQELAAATKIEAENADALLLTASTLLVEQDYAKAQELLDLAVQKHPKRADVYQRRAFLALANKDLDKAAEELKAGAQAVDNPRPLLEQLARLQYDKRDLDGFRATCAQMRKLEGFPQEYLKYQDAQLKLAEGKFLEAARELELVRPAMERLSIGYLGTVNMQLGRAYEVLGMPDRQLEVYRRVLAAAPNMLEARIGETMSLQALGRFEESAESIKVLTDNAHVNPQLQPAILQVVINQEMSKPVDARNWDATQKIAAMIEETGQRTPLQSQLLKAELLLMQRKSDEALAILGALRKENPKDVTVWLSIAKLFAAEDKYRDRLPQLLTLAERDLGDVWPLQAERIKLASRGGEKATAELQKLEAANKNYEQAAQLQLTALLGSAYLQIGSYDDALRCFKVVMENEKGNVRVRQIVFEIATERKDRATIDALLKELRESSYFGTESALYRYCAAADQLAAFSAQRQGKTTPLDERELKQLADVRKLVDEGIAARGEWAPLWRLRGELDQYSGNINGAIDNFQRSLTFSQSGQGGTARRLVQLLYATRRFTEANEAMRYLEGAELTDEMRKLAELTKFKSGDAKKAIEMAKSDIEKDPENPSNYTWYGELLESDGDGEGAEAAFRQATVKGPKLSKGWELLVRRLLSNKKTEDAAAAVKQGAAALSDTPLAVGRLYQRLGDVAEAEKQYQAALAAKPGDLMAMRHLAELYITQNKVAEATAQLDKVMAAGQASQEPNASEFVAWARNQKAQNLAASGRDYQSTLEAIKLIEQNKKDNKLSPQDSLAIVNMLAPRMNEPASRDKAIGLLEDVKKQLEDQNQDLNLPPAQLVLLARLYDRAGNWDKARALMEEAVSESKDNPEACIYFADMLIAHESYDDAKNYLTRAEELLQSSFAQPASAQAQTVRTMNAKLLAKDGNKEEAARVLESWLPRPLPQANLTWVLDVARQMEILELFEPAERLYNEYVTLSPKDGRLVLAAYYGRRGDLDQSYAMLEQAIEGASMSEVLAVALANARNFPEKSTPEHFRKIEEWAKSARELTTEPEKLSMLLAEMYDLEGRYDEVVKIYRQMLADPKLDQQNKAIVQNNLAFVLAAVDPTPERGAEAQKLIEDAIRVLGPTSDVLDTRAIAFLAQGKVDEAAADLRAAVGDRPTTAKYYHLAQVEKQMGNVDAARAAIVKAQELQGEHNPFTPAERKGYEQLKSEMN